MTTSIPPDHETNSDSLIGCVLADRYRIDALLDAGAMGRVFVGEHVLMRKRVAIKLLRHELTVVPEVVARFEREAMAAAHIEHQNVAAATDFGRLEDGTVFLVLEYVEGRSLRALIEQGPTEPMRVLRIGRQIASALAAAHNLNIVHRDLKPENVMLVGKSHDAEFVKVLDFGIAKVPFDVTGAPPETGRPITKAGMVFGTPEYMPPEQALGQDVDGRADIYSLGVILYELMTGLRPFDSGGELGVLGQQLQHDAPPMAKRAPGVSVPPEIEAFLASMLVREASRRIQTAQEVLRGIDALLQGPPPSSGKKRFLRGQVKELWRDEVTLQRVVSTESLEEVKQRAANLTATAKQGVERLLERGQDTYGAIIERLETTLSKAPAPVSRASAVAVFWGALGSVLLIVVLIAVVTSSGSAEPSDAAARQGQSIDAVSQAELEAAKAAGIESLMQLQKAHPKDARVSVALADALVAAKRHGEAVALVESALTSNAQLGEEPGIARVLWQTAQAAASSNATFKLLQGAMQAKGADIIFDLATVPNVKPEVQRRARAWMDTRKFERAASPQLAIAAALFRASACRQRKGLLKRAENVADARSLDLLHQFNQGKGCAAGEDKPCNACIRGSQPLLTAIKRIEQRREQAKADRQTKAAASAE